jgi:hypothetical protein
MMPRVDLLQAHEITHRKPAEERVVDRSGRQGRHVRFECGRSRRQATEDLGRLGRGRIGLERSR